MHEDAHRHGDTIPARPELVECPYLFVYGTLRSESSRRSAMTLSGFGDLVAAASARGYLYQVGATYPGAIFDDEAASLIRGEVWKIHNPHTSLPILDRYEEAAPLIPLDDAEYERRLVAITCWHVGSCDALPRRAWAYEFRRSLLHPSTPIIASGDFLETF